MYKNIKANIKTIFPLFILTTIFLILSIELFSDTSLRYESIKKLDEGVSLSIKISKLIHEIQKERGLSIGFLSQNKKDTEFKKNLMLQRKKTDEVARGIKVNLIPLRNRIDNKSISYNEVIQKYSIINNHFIDRISRVLKISKLPDIAQKILAYTYFLQLKEIIGLQRALGVSIILDDNITIKKIHKFYALMIEENVYQKLLFKFSSKNIKRYYMNFFNYEYSIVIRELKEIIVNENKIDISHINVHRWFYNMTLKIDELRIIDNSLSQNILDDSEKELSLIRNSFMLQLFFNVFVFSIFILMLKFILDLLRHDRDMKELLDEHIISSTTDLKGRITSSSKAFCAISGYKKDELVGKDHKLVRHEDMPKESFQEMWTTLKDNNVWRGEIKNLKKDGSSYWVYAIISPLYDKYSNKIGYSAIRQNISDKKLIEELNTSLEKKAKELSDKISVYAKHASTTIDDFREFFRPYKDKKKTTYNELILSVLNIIEVSIVNKNITIVQNLESKEVFETYPNEIKQVILNILKNAEDVLVENEVKNPTITISTKDAVLTICDNAEGVSKNIIEKIFDPCFSTKLKKNGTGLGLYMSKNIIEKHCGGKLSVSHHDGNCVFTLELEKQRRLKI